MNADTTQIVIVLALGAAFVAVSVWRWIRYRLWTRRARRCLAAAYGRDEHEELTR